MSSLLIKTFIMLFVSGLTFASSSNDNRIPTQSDEFPAIGRIYAEIDGSVLQVSDQFYNDLNQTILESQSKNKIISFNFCTATLLPENFLLTAGHCYEQAFNFNSVKIKTFFQPSKIGSLPVQLSIPGMTWKFGKIFNREYLKDDWAIIKLNQSIPQIKPLRFFILNPSDKEKIEVETIGYPFTVKNLKPKGFVLYKNRCQFLNEKNIRNQLDQNTVLRIQGSNILNCYNSQGNSGGPVIYKLKVGSSIENVIVGVTVANLKTNAVAQFFNQVIFNKETSPITFIAPIDEILEAVLR